MEKSVNLAEETALQLYMREIGRSNPLSADEEAMLSALIRKGDKKALHRMVEANLRFVVSVARNYQHQGLPLGDLINEGNVGLIRAAKRFDETKKFKFISYAVWWVRQAILQALAEQSRIVNLPLNRVGAIYKIGKALKKLEQKYFRVPNVDEIADETQLKSTEVKATMKIGDRHMSLEAPLDKGEDSNMYDLLIDDKQEMPDEKLIELTMHNEIGNMLDLLNERERQIVKLYFGLGDETAYTLEEIGKRFNLTRERARQIKEIALKRLRRSNYTRRLRAYIRS
ncbi:MAG: sigma-70 family RNA polymerase sigma factor [Chitinivibrionales bacterium]|nr:sigma-70 family RNA polymerase sigma factor [Chitinivibrionales bacterium]